MGRYDKARVRAMRRKSPWNLLLIPAVVVPWLGAWWCSIVLLGHAYHLVHPETSFITLPDTFGSILMGLGPLFAWLPVAMVLGNLLVHAIPVARRALDTEAATVPGTDFRSANRGLLRASALLFPLGLAVSLVGLFV